MNKFIYQKDYPVVQTKEGALRGYEWKGTCIFKGIPYAHAQRFRKPERVKPWDGVKDVQSYGYVSPLLHPEQPGRSLLRRDGTPLPFKRTLVSVWVPALTS